MFIAKLGRNNNFNAYQLVATAAITQAGNTLALNAHYLARLSTFGNLHGNLTIKCGNFNVRTQGCLNNVNGHFAQYSSTITFKELVRLHVQVNVQVTARSALSTCFTFVRYTQAGAIINASRNFNLKLLVAFNSTLATTFFTGFANDFAFALTSGARTFINHLTEHSILSKAHITATITFGTSFYLGTGFCAFTMAMVANFVTIQVDFFFQAESSFFKGDFQIETQICATLGTSLRASAATTALTAKEHVEDIFHATAAKASETTCSTEATTAAHATIFKSSMTELVILGAFLLVGKNTVSFITFFKLFCSFRVIFIQIRMIFTRQFAVCFFQLILGSCFRHTQDLVIISFTQSLHHPKFNYFLSSSTTSASTTSSSALLAPASGPAPLAASVSL